jgi:bifunctional DNA-binding transcriptional regulator/antitoxin component of YhaV-PrlF toxin-antitoxin module
VSAFELPDSRDPAISRSMKAVRTITRRGAVTLPAELRRRDNINAGEEFEV